MTAAASGRWRAQARRLADELAIRVELRLERLLLAPPAYRPLDWPAGLAGLADALGRDVVSFLGEPELQAIEREVSAGIVAIPKDAPLPAVHVADLGLARLCYALCRALRPRVVVETGVAYGTTSAFILQALERNGEGTLDSVDRPPPIPGAAACVGTLVPPRLRPRWRLHHGASGRLLPPLVARLPRVDLFLHDSRHTYRNILAELRTVTPRLAPGGVVLADDVERNRAFAAWAHGARPRFWGVLREAGKPSLLGVAVAPGAAS